jgi:RHS repeat-associated protein
VVRVATPSDVPLNLEYAAFGAVTGAGWMPQGLAGGLFDPDTGLVRFGARDYDPQTGRLTSKDPILGQGGQANLYVYTNNDPVNFGDPRGTGPSPCAVAVIACIGLAAYLAIDDFLDVDACEEAAEKAKPELDACGTDAEGVERRQQIEQRVRNECMREQASHALELALEAACGGVVAAACLSPTP